MKNPQARILMILSFIIMVVSIILTAIKKSGFFLFLVFVMLIICAILIKDAMNSRRTR